MSTDYNFKKARKRELNGKKTLSMEEKSPTMLYMFVKSLYISASHAARQGVFYYAKQKIESAPRALIVQVKAFIGTDII